MATMPDIVFFPSGADLSLRMTLQKISVFLKLKSLVACVLLSSCAKENFEEQVNESASPAVEATPAEAALSFSDLPLLDEPFIDPAPAAAVSSIAVGKLGRDGGDKDAIIKMAQEIADGEYGNLDSLLITHKGKLLFESYYRRGRINLAHGQASATKGYTSLILGRAIQLGYLTMADLDKPLVSFLQDLDPSKFVMGAEKITLHKALIMHGGLSVSREDWEELEKNPAPLQGQGLVQTLLENSGPITAESQSYLYGNFNPILVMAVIDAVVPGTAREFIETEILAKLEITNYSWETHVSGLPQAGWMVSMTSRDMLKWGDVVLNDGKWRGEQLLSIDYLERATTGMVKPTEDWMPDEYRYGYFWYQADLAVGNESYDTTFAWGGGGQRVVVVDDLELVIAITGHDREDTIMTAVANIILPAFTE